MNHRKGRLIAGVLAMLMVCMPWIALAETEATFQVIVKNDLAGTVLTEQTVTVAEADADQNGSVTAEEAVKAALDKAGLSYDIPQSTYGAYIESIDGLAGATPAANVYRYWSFLLNDTVASVGISGATLADGDKVSIVYVEDDYSSYEVDPITVHMEDKAAGTVLTHSVEGLAKITDQDDDGKITAFDAVVYICKLLGIPCEAGAGYVSSIDGKAAVEVSAGDWRYWNFYYNGEASNVGLGDVVLKAEDTVAMLYGTAAEVAGEAGGEEEDPEEIVQPGTHEAVNSLWRNFRNNNVNMAIVSADLPDNADEAELLWKTAIQTDNWAVSNPILVDGCVVITGDDTLYKVDQATGKVVASVKMPDETDWYGVTPIYAEGLIIVPLIESVWAFDAKTLAPAWQYTHATAEGSASPLTYVDGKLIGSFYSYGDGTVTYCLDVTDEDGTKGNEVKEALWTLEGDNFYWDGAAVVGDKVVFGSMSGKVYMVDVATGAVVDTAKAEGGIRSSMAYDAGYVYFTTYQGQCCKLAVSGEGLGAVQSVKLPGTSATSTPVVYQGRAYVGYGDGWNEGGVAVIDTKTMEVIYTAAATGPVQSSGLISTSEGDRVQVYFTCNSEPGGILLLDDKAGQKAGKLVEVFAPEDAQFCMGSLICDGEGTIYYRNDSYVLMAIKTTPGSEEAPEATPTVKPTATAAPTAKPNPEATPSVEGTAVPDTAPVETGDTLAVMPLLMLMVGCMGVCLWTARKFCRK